MSLENNNPNEQLNVMRKTFKEWTKIVTEENKQTLLKGSSMEEIGMIMDIVPEKLKSAPTEKIKLILEAVSAEIANISLIRKMQEETVKNKLKTLEVLVDGKLNSCPFPQHKGYVELRKKIKNNPEEQKKMKENFRISSDGKIESVKMKKKFSILTAEHNGKNIFKGEYKDQYGNM